ncbi:hypothetical protein P8918_13835 [Bacillus spizizenii]|nr:hypothetical protein [Bacillus spizizenii]MCY8890384.1 hypothetical protein [Bacillus spizizenii]MEC0842110.1 hypothetical protein [Bacillus spizizenii]
MSEAFDVEAKAEQEEVKHSVSRVTPKLPYEMNHDELLKRKKEVKKRLRRAVQNYEFYYYNEMKEELDAINEQLEQSKGVLA